MSQRNRQPMHGPGRNMGSGEKAKDFRGTIRRLLRYMKPYRFQLIFICIFAIASTIFSIIGPKILGSATTLLAEGLAAKYTQQGSIDFAGIFTILRNLLLIYLASALFSYIQGWMMATVTQKTTYSLRKEISVFLITRLSLGQIRQRGQKHGCETDRHHTADQSFDLLLHALLPLRTENR